MAIVINGDGSISGISAGGLPTGSVTADTLATNSVDSDELVNGAIDAGHLASGVGGAWTLIGTQTASASASLTQTGLDSTYDTYAIVFSDMVPAGDGEYVRFRVGDSGGVDSAASDYCYHYTNMTTAGTTYTGGNDTANDCIILMGTCGNATGEGWGGVAYINRPGDGSVWPIIHFYGGSLGPTANQMNTLGAFGARLASITLDRVNISMSSSNITSGRMSVFGIAHT